MRIFVALVAATLPSIALATDADAPMGLADARAYCEGMVGDARSAPIPTYGTPGLVGGLAGVVGDLVAGRDPSYSMGRVAEQAVRGAGQDWERSRYQRDARERAIQNCVAMQQRRGIYGR